MSHFQTRVKNFFAIRENFFSRRPFGRGQLVGANGFMRLFDPTVKHFSAKIEKMFWADLCIALLGVLTDQFTKYLAVTCLKDRPAFPLIPGVLELRYLENRGAAFGLLQNQKIFFVIMTCLILAFCLYVLTRMPSGKKQVMKAH